ncbi:MAG: 3'-5' exonuclease, partial [Oscillospiraceae bacterium]
VQLIDMNQSEMENRRILVEAQQTAKQIKKMIKEEVLVTENGGLRPCRGGDFVILLRSQKNTDILFAEALEQENIDSLLGASSGYFSSREVSVMISLLQILDNPILNIPMAAVLLSPMFSFSCDELAALTLYHPERSFYAALLLEAGKGKRKAREFVRIFDLLRAKSAVMNIQKLIQYIYDTTDFMEVMSSFSGASEREANLKLLLKYALDYEASGNHELSGFVSYLDYLIENGKDFEVANPLNEAAHSVRIMTIHKSKGLEFPIVIVANCSKRHNTQDLIGSTVLDMTLGLGMKFIDRDHLRQYETIPYLAIQSFEQQNMLSEEMRLLYVALTRAKEKLILNVTEENLGRKLQKLETYFDTEGNISPYSVGKAQSYSDWILMALLGHPAFSAVRQQYDIWIPQNSETCSLQLFETAVEKVEITEESAVELSAPSDPQKMESMDYQIHYCYPYLTETRTPAKLSVTEITHPPEEETLLSPPKFMGEKEFTSAQKGSIFHRVLQFCDFHAGQLDAQAELDRLTALRFLTPKEQAAVNLQKLELFFSSSLMSRILGADRVLREYKFFDTIPAKEAGFDGNAPILVQGIADCILVENGKGVIIDFKTDAVSSPDILEKRYAGQLTLYRRALQNVFPNGIGECILYSVHLGTEIIVKA